MHGRPHVVQDIHGTHPHQPPVDARGGGFTAIPPATALEYGQSVCGSLHQGAGYQEVEQGVIAGLGFTVTEARVLIGAATDALCPEYASVTAPHVGDPADLPSSAGT